MSPQKLNNIPAEAVNVDPTAFCPLWLGLGQEARQRAVIEVINGQVILGEIDDGDLARGTQGWHRGMATVRLTRVHPRLGAG